MAEYIDKDALLDDIAAAVENGGLGAVVAGTMKRYIMRVPADNVAPVVHARWIEVGFEAQDVFGRLPPVKVVRGYRCSVCNRFERGKEPYCHCGAKMDLRRENDDGSEKA